MWFHLVQIGDHLSSHRSSPLSTSGPSGVLVTLNVFWQLNNNNFIILNKTYKAKRLERMEVSSFELSEMNAFRDVINGNIWGCL